MISKEDGPIKASNGESLATISMDQSSDFYDLFLICAGYHPLDGIDAKDRAFIQRQARSSAIIGGIDTGGQILAELGLLNGYRAVVHWQAEAAFLENPHYQSIQLSREIFTQDRNRLTMAGGTATADAIIH